MQQEQQFKDALRAAGERVTAPRLTVFRLMARHAPLSMPRLLARTAEAGLDNVTVYRTMNLFRALGFVQEVGLGRNRLLELSDRYQAHHHHFACLTCGAITDFDSETIEATLSKISSELGFSIASHQLELTGICESCQSKTSSGLGA